MRRARRAACSCPTADPTCRPTALSADRSASPTTPCRYLTSCGKPDSTFIPWSAERAATVRSSDDTATVSSGDAARFEVAGVELEDPPPLRVEVDLGEDEEDARAEFFHRPEEPQLGAGQLLRGVGEEEDGVRPRQRADRDGVVQRAEPADTGGVDQHQPTREQLAADRRRDRPQLPQVAGVAGFTHVRGQVFERDPLGPRRRRRIGRLVGRQSPGLRREPDDRRHRGRDVVVDRADLRGEQGVDERTLALLELPDHVDGDVGLGQQAPGVGEALDEVVPPVRLRTLDREVECVEGDGPPAARLLHDRSFSFPPAQQCGSTSWCW